MYKIYCCTFTRFDTNTTLPVPMGRHINTFNPCQLWLNWPIRSDVVFCHCLTGTKKLSKEDKVILRKVCSRVLDSLEVTVDLLTYFCVNSAEPFNSRQFKVDPTEMSYGMKQVMPEPSVFEQCRLTI